MSLKINLPQSPMECLNFVGGKFIPGKGHTIPVKSPYTGAIIGRFGSSTPPEVDEAVLAAHKAFLHWQEVPLKERCQLMFVLRENLIKNMNDISNLISAESGKTLKEAQAEIYKGIEVLEFAIGLQNMDLGGKMEVSRGVFCEFQRRPLGVVAGITPFNFPAMVPMWMIPIAITLGNTFVWKPSDKTPLTSQKLAQAFKASGFPDGVFTVLQGGKETVESLLIHPMVKAIGFVGSTAVAKKVYQLGTQHFKRVLALGGAKNHIILMPDADSEMAAQGIVDSFTGCAGQRCMASSVLLAVGDVDSILDKIKEKSLQKTLGKEMGAIIGQESLKFLNESIDKAVQEGGKLLLDGRGSQAPSEYGSNGNWIAPTIIDQVQPDSSAAKVELFGPVLSIIRCQNLSEALAIEKGSSYGNAASVFTSNGAIAEKVAQEAASGMIGINIGVPVPREPFSFGGIGDSKFGHGDITGPSSLDFWSFQKKITRKWALQNDHNWMS